MFISNRSFIRLIQQQQQHLYQHQLSYHSNTINDTLPIQKPYPQLLRMNHVAMIHSTSSPLPIQSHFHNSLLNRTPISSTSLSLSLSSSSSSVIKTSTRSAVTVKDSIVTTVAWIKPRIRTYTVVGGVLLGLYTIADVGFSVASFFAHLDFLDVGKVAFVCGCLTTVACGGMIYAGSRMLALRPEQVFGDCVRLAKAHPKVVSKLGDPIEIGAFKSFSFLEGKLVRPEHVEKPTNLKAWTTFFSQFWQPRQLQIAFQLNGSKGSAVILAEVEKYRGVQKYNSLLMDMMNTGEQVILQGSPSKQLMRAHSLKA